MHKRGVVREYAQITGGIFIASVGIYFFMIRGELVFGSVTGLSMILDHFIPLGVPILNLILNIALLILGLLLIGKEFGVKTIYTSIIFPVFLEIWERIFPDIPSLSGDKLTDMLCCIFIVSMGQAIMFKANASSGGLDIVAKIVNKYFHLELGTALAVVGAVVVASSIFVYDSRTLVLGFLGTYLNGMVVDFYISGFTRKRRVCIMSEKYPEIQKFIMEKINRGVTLYSATGGYKGQSQIELVTILDKNEYAMLMEFIERTDEKAFITISSVAEVVGMWNRKH